MKLIETIDLMCSSDYKERFKAEYYQLAERFKSLNSMLVKWDDGKLDFRPTCPRQLYDIQIEAMADYLSVLERRAALEGIAL